MRYRLSLNFHKNTSIHQEMAKKPIFKISGIFLPENKLFKTTVKPPILPNLKCLTFFYVLVQEKYIQIETLKIRSS